MDFVTTLKVPNVAPLGRSPADGSTMDSVKTLKVPNVFIGGDSVGGGDETAELHRSGTLHDLLLAAGAVDST
jgi:hypothetical protein